MLLEELRPKKEVIIDEDEEDVVEDENSESN